MEEESQEDCSEYYICKFNDEIFPDKGIDRVQWVELHHLLIWIIEKTGQIGITLILLS